MFTLNVMCTYLAGYYNRNDKVRTFLEDKNSEFRDKNEVINRLNYAAEFVDRMNIPQGSMWWNKANFFSLVCEIARFPGQMQTETLLEIALPRSQRMCP